MRSRNLFARLLSDVLKIVDEVRGAHPPRDGKSSDGVPTSPSLLTLRLLRLRMTVWARSTFAGRAIVRLRTSASDEPTSYGDVDPAHHAASRVCVCEATP